LWSAGIIQFLKIEFYLYKSKEHMEFQTYHKKNKYGQYKAKMNAHNFAFPKEILKDKTELDNIYDYIPKFWTRNKLMTLVEDLDMSVETGQLSNAEGLDDVDFKQVDEEVLKEMLLHNGALILYLINNWPEIGYNEKLIAIAVDDCSIVLDFIDKKKIPNYKKLVSMLQQRQNTEIITSERRDEMEVEIKKEKDPIEEKWGDLCDED
jgi:hypothetical protein